MNRTLLFFLLTLLIALSCAPLCQGTGFYNPDLSVSAQGQADAVVARPQDASTVYYNPAGMVDLPPWQVTAGLHTLFSDLEYVNPMGQKQTASDTFFVPYAYFCANPPNTRFAFGLGLNSPFGLGTDWGPDSFARYVAPYSELELIMINPNVAYRLTDSLSVAAGANFYTADIRLDRYLPPNSLPGIPPGVELSTRIDADGDAWGWNLALLYDISDRVSVGASYRSKADIDFSGSLKTDPPAPISPSCSLDMNLPSTLTAGLAVNLSDRFSLEFDVQWLEWSRFKNVTIAFSPPVIPPEVSPRSWDDILLYSLGAQYTFHNGWKIRAGYGYAESPIPDRTYEPGIPRNDVHVLSLGFGKSFSKLTLDIACSVILSEKRNVDSDIGGFAVDGIYDSTMTVVGGGLSYTF